MPVQYITENVAIINRKVSPLSPLLSDASWGRARSVQLLLSQVLGCDWRSVERGGTQAASVCSVVVATPDAFRHFRLQQRAGLHNAVIVPLYSGKQRLLVETTRLSVMIGASQTGWAGCLQPCCVEFSKGEKNETVQ